MPTLQYDTSTEWELRCYFQTRTRHILYTLVLHILFFSVPDYLFRSLSKLLASMFIPFMSIRSHIIHFFPLSPVDVSQNGLSVTLSSKPQMYLSVCSWNSSLKENNGHFLYHLFTTWRFFNSVVARALAQSGETWLFEVFLLEKHISLFKRQL